MARSDFFSRVGLRSSKETHLGEAYYEAATGLLKALQGRLQGSLVGFSFDREVNIIEHVSHLLDECGVTSNLLTGFGFWASSCSKNESDIGVYDIYYFEVTFSSTLLPIVELSMKADFENQEIEFLGVGYYDPPKVDTLESMYSASLFRPEEPVNRCAGAIRVGCPFCGKFPFSRRPTETKTDANCCDRGSVLFNLSTSDPRLPEIRKILSQMFVCDSDEKRVKFVKEFDVIVERAHLGLTLKERVLEHRRDSVSPFVLSDDDLLELAEFVTSHEAFFVPGTVMLEAKMLLTNAPSDKLLDNFAGAIAGSTMLGVPVIPQRLENSQNEST